MLSATCAALLLLHPPPVDIIGAVGSCLCSWSLVEPRANHGRRRGLCRSQGGHRRARRDLRQARPRIRHALVHVHARVGHENALAAGANALAADAHIHAHASGSRVRSGIRAEACMNPFFANVTCAASQ
eukprot:3140915-Pleurochrysis_carterae.AAC.1